jgi:hypothetical protein
MMRSFRLTSLRFCAAGLWAIAVGAPSFLATPAEAQTVSGIVSDRSTGEPIPTAIVVLLDQRHAEVGRGVSRPDGQFQLRAPSGGRYLLRVERIGYERQESDAFTIPEAGSATFDFAVRSVPVNLSEIEVEGERRGECAPISSAAGVDLVRVWEQVTAALGATEVSTRGQYRFRAVNSERILHPRSLDVVDEVRRTRALSGPTPYRTIPAEVAAREGFVHESREAVDFYAPDARLLLSQEFQEIHCFDLAVVEHAPDRIGIRFEPIRTWRRPGIQGTLWVDRESAELRFMEFEYVRLPWSVTTEHTGGRVEFLRLPSGAWIVSRWRIRTPYLQVRTFQFRGQTQERLAVAAIHEEGSEITQVRTLRGDVVLALDEGRPAVGEGSVEEAGEAAPPPEQAPSLFVDRVRSVSPGLGAWFSGQVLDAETEDPVVGMEVRVGSSEAVSDEDGWFQLRRLPAGRHQVEVRHEGYVGGTVAVTLRLLEEAVVTLRVHPRSDPAAVP